MSAIGPKRTCLLHCACLLSGVKRTSPFAMTNSNIFRTASLCFTPAIVVPYFARGCFCGFLNSRQPRVFRRQVDALSRRKFGIRELDALRRIGTT